MYGYAYTYTYVFSEIIYYMIYIVHKMLHIKIFYNVIEISLQRFLSLKDVCVFEKNVVNALLLQNFLI